jgi:hypothetical protein
MKEITGFSDAVDVDELGSEAPLERYDLIPDASNMIDAGRNGSLKREPADGNSLIAFLIRQVGVILRRNHEEFVAVAAQAWD